MRFVEVDGIPFEVLPTTECVLITVLDPLRNRILPVSLLKRITGGSESPLVQESIIRPGGWRSMNIVYANRPPVDWVDRMAVRYNPISMATRNRRKLVTAKLTEILKGLSGEAHVHLLGIGAGPGLHLQDAVLAAGLSPSQVKMWLIDRDADAFDYGRRSAAERGLQECVEFVQGDAREIRSVLPHVSPRVIKIVGLLEYLSDEQTLQLLKALCDVIHPQGRLLTHGLVDRYNSGLFLARAFGLKHTQRTADEIQSLLKSSGFQTIGSFEEPMQIYPVVVARPA